MKRSLWPSYFKVYLTGLVIGLSFMGGHVLPVLAQTGPTFRPRSTGAPGNREAGANRGNQGSGDAGGCATGEQGLVALVPADTVAYTANPFPALYAYFPSNRAQFAEFAIYEADSNELVYGTLFNVTGDSGLVTIELPDTATVSPLQVGQSYNWFLTLICNVGNRAQDMVVDGRFERVSGSDVTQRLQGISVVDRSSIYADAGLWPETMASLIQVNESDPLVAEQHLQVLLKSVDLTEALPDGPLLP